jgi:hypothetical protein
MAYLEAADNFILNVLKFHHFWSLNLAYLAHYFGSIFGGSSNRWRKWRQNEVKKKSLN